MNEFITIAAIRCYITTYRLSSRGTTELKSYL